MEAQGVRCIFCHEDALEAAVTEIIQRLGEVKVTIEGVPAMRCRACGEISIGGEVVEPIDESIEQVFIATGAMTSPGSEDESESHQENHGLIRTMRPDDSRLDTPAGEPSGAGSPAR